MVLDTRFTCPECGAYLLVTQFEGLCSRCDWRDYGKVELIDIRQLFPVLGKEEVKEDAKD